MDYKYFYRVGIIIGFSSRFDRNLFIYGSENRILWRYYSEPTIYIDEKVLLDILIVGKKKTKRKLETASSISKMSARG